MTEQLKRVLSRHNYRIAMRLVSTPKDQLMRPKDPVIRLIKAGFVHSM